MPRKPPTFYWKYQGKDTLSGTGKSFTLNGALMRVRRVTGYTGHRGVITLNRATIKTWRPMKTSHSITVSWDKL